MVYSPVARFQAVGYIHVGPQGGIIVLLQVPLQVFLNNPEIPDCVGNNRATVQHIVFIFYAKK